MVRTDAFFRQAGVVAERFVTWYDELKKVELIVVILFVHMQLQVTELQA